MCDSPSVTCECHVTPGFCGSLFSDGPFSIYFIYFRSDISRGIHSHFHSPLTFLWLGVQEAACQGLGRLMFEEKTADSRCFFSSCFAYYFEKLTLLKNRFQMFCLFGSKSERVAQLGEVEVLSKQAHCSCKRINKLSEVVCFFCLLS